MAAYLNTVEITLDHSIRQIVRGLKSNQSLQRGNRTNVSCNLLHHSLSPLDPLDTVGSSNDSAA